MKQLILIILSIFVFTQTAFGYVNFIRTTVAPKTLQFSLKNPNGLITGYDNGILRTQMPYLSYSLSAVDGADSTATEFETFYKIEATKAPLPTPLISGKYQLTIYNPLQTAKISEIMIYLDSTENLPLGLVAKSLIYPNSIWMYEFEIPSNIVPTKELSPDAPFAMNLALIKVSTPADLIKDLTTAGQLGYIGNPKFVSEVTKEINEIEKNKILYEKDDTAIPPNQITRKEYQELLSKITERYNKPEVNEFVKEEAYTVLKEDLEYIIGHL